MRLKLGRECVLTVLLVQPAAAHGTIHSEAGVPAGGQKNLKKGLRKASDWDRKRVGSVSSQWEDDTSSQCMFRKEGCGGTFRMMAEGVNTILKLEALERVTANSN
ncbi:hypothetical protein B0H11DRAFT_1927768 [Mycena galericulata]|nr:hypothetical protein B0H11DRAFT_1927768 [Mycena galericulata]